MTTAAGGTAVRFIDAGKRFGEEWAVRNLDVEFPTGSITGLIGPSGCGKTTTVRLITGAYHPDEGEVATLGRSPAELEAHDRTGLGYLPQEPVLFDELSVWENINFLAALQGVGPRRRSRLHEVLDLVELDQERKKLVGQCSGGMKRRLALAGSLVHRPPLLLLDEPTAGIDPILRRRFWEHFRRLRDEGHTLVVATQYVGEATDCDLVVLLADGGVVASGSPDELRREAYGGDVIEVTTREPIDPPTFADLRRLGAVRSATALGGNRVRLVVDDGGLVLPDVLRLLEEKGHQIADSEEIIDDYDDVFVRLVERRTVEPA